MNASETMESVLKSILFDVVLKFYLQKLILAVPFLGLSWLYPAVAFVAESLLKPFYKELCNHGNFILIDIEMYKKDHRYIEATEALAAALKTEGNQHAITEAANEMRLRLGQLIRLRPS